MLRKVNIRSTVISALIGGVLFAVPTYFFIRSQAYEQAWLLYLGNFLFFIEAWRHTLKENKLRRENESTVALVFISHVATIAAIVVACILSFILLALMVPGFIGATDPQQGMIGEPANTIQGKTDGLAFKVFFAAVVINFSVGSFAGLILPFYSKRNQVRDSKDPSPLHQYGER
jgi:hypothetical protein